MYIYIYYIKSLTTDTLPLKIRRTTILKKDRFDKGVLEKDNSEKDRHEKDNYEMEATEQTTSLKRNSEKRQQGTFETRQI